MVRHNFSARTKNAALARSDGRCEAIGLVYGLPKDERCQREIYKGRVHYDHYPRLAIDEGSDGLDNCVACCPECHKLKTARYDIPMIAKGRRIRGETRTKRVTIRSRPAVWAKRKMQSRPFHRRTP